MLISWHWLSLAVFSPWKLVIATAEAFLSSMEVAIKYLPTRPWLKVAFKWGTRNCANAFRIIFSLPPPRVLLSSTPSALCVYFWRNPSVMFTEVKAIDCLFVQRFYVAGSDFTHISSFWSAPQPWERQSLYSHFQFAGGKLQFGMAPWESWGKVRNRTWRCSPPLCYLWKSLNKAATIPRTDCGQSGRAKLQREQKWLLCGLGLHSVILYVEANCPFNYCVGCTEIDVHSLNHWQQPEWPRCSEGRSAKFQTWCL